MKRSLGNTFLLTLILATTLIAAEPKQHSAVVAAHRHSWWTLRHEAVKERVEKGDVDLLMIGDSITHSWEGGGKELWQKYYAPRKAVNLGFSGDRTQHVLWRLENGEIDGICPKLAVIMIGTNNSNGKDNTAEEIADGIKTICKKLRSELPEMKILILAIFPRAPKPCPQREKNEKASDLASKIADGKMIHYLNINKHFLTEDGTLTKEIMPDSLHPNTKGYEIWAKAMEPKIAELMGEKKSHASDVRVGEVDFPAELIGRVVGVDGAPVVDAAVAYSSSGRTIFMGNRNKHAVGYLSGSEKYMVVKTDAEGKFNLGDWPEKSFTVVATGKSGYAMIDSNEFAKDLQIMLTPWCSVKGRIANGRKALDGKVRLRGFPAVNWQKHRLRFTYNAVCDGTGEFVIENMPAGWYEAAYRSPIGGGDEYTRRTPVILKPGEVGDVTIGAKGRTVVGKFVTPSWYKDKMHFGKGDKFLFAALPTGKSPDHLQTEEDMKWIRGSGMEVDNWYCYMLDIKDDGTFRIEDVLPDGYRLIAFFEEEHKDGSRSKEIASYFGAINVPATDAQSSDAPVDLGELMLTMR